MVQKSSTFIFISTILFSVYCLDVVIKPNDVTSMTILTSVHAPWNNCIATVPSPQLKPNQSYSKAQRIDVGGCDKGPIAFSVAENNNTYPCAQNDKLVVTVTLYSEDLAAMPPTCPICWNGSYLIPTTMAANESLLPGCQTSDSVEGYHMTYYWFHIMSWTTK